jgi:hypothetical protein
MFLCVRATEAEAAAALDAEVSAPADCAMVLIGLLAVGFLGGAFVLYVLVGLSRAFSGFQWTPDGAPPQPIRHTRSQRSAAAIRPLDIFQFEPDGSPVWKGAATDLGSAELSVKVKVVAFDSPGEYVIYRQKTGHKTS